MQVWIIAKRWKQSPVGWFLESFYKKPTAFNWLNTEIQSSDYIESEFILSFAMNVVDLLFVVLLSLSIVTYVTLKVRNQWNESWSRWDPGKRFKPVQQTFLAADEVIGSRQRPHLLPTPRATSRDWIERCLQFLHWTRWCRGVLHLI